MKASERKKIIKIRAEIKKIWSKRKKDREKHQVQSCFFMQIGKIGKHLQTDHKESQTTEIRKENGDITTNPRVLKKKNHEGML